MTRKSRNRGLFYPGPGQRQRPDAEAYPVSPEAAARLAQAEADLAAAQQAMDAARDRFIAARQERDEALAQASEGDDLVRLALDSNNPAARARLHDRVRALHPGIVGYWPAPDPNDDGYFSGNREEFGLALDYIAEDATEEFLGSLAEALRFFTRTFRPKFNSKGSPRPGYSQAFTRGGVIHYRLKASLPGYGAWTGEDQEQTAPLETLLAAVPDHNFLSALAGQDAPREFVLHSQNGPS